MALLYIAEYDRMAEAPAGPPQIVQEPPIIEQTPVVIGAGSLQSAFFGTRTRIVRIHADSICSIAFGINPTASVQNKRMAASQTEYFGVAPGMKVAVIANT